MVYGGVDMNAQIAELRRGVEVLVATPGRLLDHVQNKTVMFNQVSVLVLDEADRMLDMGFLPDIKRIIALLPKERQNLLFSATFPDEIRNARAHAPARSRPKSRSRARNAAAELGDARAAPGRAREEARAALAPHPDARPEAGAGVLRHAASAPTASRTSCARDHIHADAIHGDKTQAERDAALEDFKAGKTAVLVATDVASRGLDIEGLPQVINFDVPHSPEDYVHRIGRTGRAGLHRRGDLAGRAARTMEALAAIERLIKKRIERVLVPGFQPSGATVAALMGTSRRGRSESTSREKRSEPSTCGASKRPRAAVKPRRPDLLEALRAGRSAGGGSPRPSLPRRASASSPRSPRCSAD